MLNIEVSEVTSRRERDAFIKFQWQIYANDPAWVPPLIIERKSFLDRKRHPFYRHGTQYTCCNEIDSYFNYRLDARGPA